MPGTLCRKEPRNRERGGSGRVLHQHREPAHCSQPHLARVPSQAELTVSERVGYAGLNSAAGPRPRGRRLRGVKGVPKCFSVR
jgi:hypothetical protein